MSVTPTTERRWEAWPDEPVPPGGPVVRVLDRLGLVGVVLVGTVLRVWQRSPLWLDEALSANIAALPLGDIPGALRHDGHPPLYYVLLHVWMDVVGDTDTAVRLLSALIGLALVPLAFVAAGRIGGKGAAWATALIVALNPFVLRYATEARMYEIVMVLVLAGWLLADHALDRPRPVLLGGLTVVTGLLLWTHYWGIWLTAAAGIGLLVRAGLARRRGEAERARHSLAVAGALFVGALTFLPWAPTLLYQASHTGTPWAEPALPTEVLAVSMVDLGGGPAGESVILTFLLVGLVALGLLGRGVDPVTVELDLRTRPEARRAALLVASTLLLAGAISYVSGAAYASRYFSVVAPFVLVLVGLGVARLRGAIAFRVVIVVVLALSTLAAGRAAVTHPRSQARVVADAIEARAAEPSPLVVVCPDQLGPSLTRQLDEQVEVLRYPDLQPADLVDWVDYEERLRATSPDAVAGQVLDRAEGRDLWLVWSPNYRTHQGTCEALATALQRARPAGAPVVVVDPEAYEGSNAYLFPAA